MDRERAETRLRLLAEAELRHTTALRADGTILHAGQRRHTRGRLGVLPGSQAPAGPVDTRQQRPLARHTHP